MNYSEYSELPEIFRGYITYLETIKSRSSSTVNEYFNDIRTFFRFLKIKRCLADREQDFESITINDVDIALIKSVTLTDVYEFLVFCKTDRDNSEKTRARKCSSLRSFFNYLTNKCNLLETNPISQLELPKPKKSLPKYLTLDQSLQLLQNVDGEYKERDYCILTLFLNCGLRLSELCGLNMNDIRSDNTVRVLGKGNKERVIYLNEACITAINDYLKVRPVDGVPAEHKNALFLSRLKRRISNKTVQHIVYQQLDKIGLSGQGYSVHKLRHTAATLMYQYGHVDIRVLKDILGHENLGTTQIYTHLSNEQIKNALKSNPLASNKATQPKESKG